MTDVCIKAGSYCPVCRGTALADCWHPAGAFRAQPAPGAGPVAWLYLFKDPLGGGPVWRNSPSEWNGQKPHGSKPLYAHPPTDSAALRDAAIAELVRRKMTSGNSVPVERCIITAAEIAAIAQQEAP